MGFSQYSNRGPQLPFKLQKEVLGDAAEGHGPRPKRKAASRKQTRKAARQAKKSARVEYQQRRHDNDGAKRPLNQASCQPWCANITLHALVFSTVSLVRGGVRMPQQQQA